MKKIINTLVIVFLFLIIGCTVRISEVSVKPTLQYKFYQEQDGLKIAIDPFFEKERLKEFFGADLISNGILPILIVVENRNPKLGYLLDKKLFSAAMEVEQKPDTKESIDPSVSIPKGVHEVRVTGSVMAGVGAIAPGLVFAALPMLFYAEKKEFDVGKINVNLSKKSFIDRTIFPGESHSGFVFFQVKDRETAKNIGVVLIKAKHIPSEKELDFVFQFKK